MGEMIYSVIIMKQGARLNCASLKIPAPIFAIVKHSTVNLFSTRRFFLRAILQMVGLNREKHKNQLNSMVESKKKT